MGARPWLIGLWTTLIVALARASDILFTWQLNPSLSREQNPAVAFGPGWPILIGASIFISLACGAVSTWHWHNRHLVPREPGLTLRQFVMLYYFGENRNRNDLLWRTPPAQRILLVLGLLLPAVMVFASIAIDIAHFIAYNWPNTRPFHNWWAGHPARLLGMYAVWMFLGAGLAWTAEWRAYVRQT